MATNNCLLLLVGFCAVPVFRTTLAKVLVVFTGNTRDKTNIVPEFKNIDEEFGGLYLKGIRKG